MEHGQLQLWRSGKQPIENLPETPIAARRRAQQETYQHKDYDTHYVENQVYRCGSLGGCATCHARDNGHDARADVAAHRQVDALVEGDQARNDHRDGDGSHHRRGLDDGRQHRADQNQQHGIVDVGQELPNGLQRGEFVHRVSHHRKSDEQHSESRQDAAYLLGCVAFAEQGHKRANASKSRKNDGGGDAVGAKHAQGHQLRRDGGADVGAIDDGGCLRQRQDAHIDEADDHHRDGAAALDGGSAHRADAHAEPLVSARL